MWSEGTKCAISEEFCANLVTALPHFYTDYSYRYWDNSSYEHVPNVKLLLYIASYPSKNALAGSFNKRSFFLHPCKIL